MKATRFAALAALLLLSGGALAEDAAAPASPAFDAALAETLGADEYGMRQYVLVILKTGPTPVPAGAARDEMFRGHFANMQRLAAEGKLALAGPLDGVDGWRGLFILAVDDLEEAAALVATDPVVIHGEMIAEYHAYYGSAALMLVNETHEKVARKGF
jgi:uncharacterized protein YciI